MSHYVDLNSDLGESFGNYTLGMDSEVLNHVLILLVVGTLEILLSWMRLSAYVKKKELP